jgi:hypothetical protein
MSPLVQLLAGTAAAGASLAWVGFRLWRFVGPFWRYPGGREGVRQARLDAPRTPPGPSQNTAVMLQAKIGLAAVGLAWGALHMSEALAHL